MTRGKLWGGLIVLFLAGVLTGVVGTYAYHRYEQRQLGEQGPAAKEERLMKRLTHELSLTSAQQEAIEPVVSRVYREVLQLRVQHQPEVEQILARGIAEVKPKLSEDQRAKLDELYARFQRRGQASRDHLLANPVRK